MRVLDARRVGPLEARPGVSTRGVKTVRRVWACGACGAETGHLVRDDADEAAHHAVCDPFAPAVRVSGEAYELGEEEAE
eukprot:scaffold64875_cov63-Phaeocystis_antarctica.AAC.2